MDGQAFSLLRTTDQVLVQLREGSGGETLDRLTAAGGPAAGASRAGTAVPGLWILELPGGVAFEELEGIRGAVAQDAGVAYAAESFVEPTSGGRLWATNEVAVALAPGIQPEDAFVAPDFTGFRRLAGTSDQYIAITTAAPGPEVVALATRLSADPRFAWASPDFLVQPNYFAAPNDPLVNQQWHLNNTGQTGGIAGADVRAFSAWDLGFTGQGVVVGILDSGVDITHPDLKDHLFINTAEVAGNGVDDDGNGYVDDVNGWNFSTNTNNPSPITVGHGTSVAGVAAGIGNNGIGIAGAAYNATILAVSLGEVPLSGSQLASAVYYTAGRNASGFGTWGNGAASVITHSYGVPALQTSTVAFDWSATSGRNGLGTVNMAATGNSAPAVPFGFISYPASLASNIAVGASTDFDLRSSYSQFGQKLDIVAPSNGGNAGISTTDIVGAGGYDATDYTNTFGGTSSATPLAAGVVALMLEANPGLSLAEVREVLRGTADKIGPLPYDQFGRNIEYGSGRINAAAAVAAVATRLELAMPAGLEENRNHTDVAIGTLYLAAGTPSQFAIQVDLDNGQSPVLAKLTPRGNNTYNVLVPQLFYQEGGTYIVDVTVNRQGTPVLTESAPLVINELVIQVSAVPKALSEGAPHADSTDPADPDAGNTLKNNLVATFRDSDPDTITADKYSVSIAWGDGSTGTGTVVDRGNNQFDVLATHPYPGGSYIVTVTVTGPGGGVFSGSAPVNVSNSLLEVTVVPVTATEGAQFQGAIARFTDADPRNQPPSYYSAEIDYGDGPYASSEVDLPIPDLIKAPKPLVSNLRLSLGTFSIADLNVTLSVQHARPADLSAVLISPAGTRVNLFSGLTKRGQDIVDLTLDDEAALPAAGQFPPFTGSFRPVNPQAPINAQPQLSDFDGEELSGTWQLELTDSKAGFTGTLLGWSLSAIAQGTVARDPAPNAPAGSYIVQGTHIYNVRSTPYTPVVRVQDSDASDVTISGQVNVQNAAITIDPARVSAVEGQKFSGILAYFQDANPQSVPASFSVMIDWQDGTSSPGLVVPDGGGRFVITGEHAFLQPSQTQTAPDGKFEVLLTLNEFDADDKLAAAYQKIVPASVANAQILGQSTTFVAVEGQPLSDTAIVRFTDGNALAKPEDYQVQINWGDGRTTAGAVRSVPGQPGAFEVTSSAAYSIARVAPYAVVVNLTDNSQKIFDLATEARVIDASLVPTGLPLTGTERVDTGLVKLGSFVDNNALSSAPGQFRATVNWGDGQSSAAQIMPAAPTNGLPTYEVWGQHAFADRGSFTVNTLVQSHLGAFTVIQSSASVADLIAPLTGRLEAISDTGVSNNDGVTNLARVSLFGQADRFATVTLYTQPIAGGALTPIGTTSSDGNGAWRFNSGPLATGQFNLLAQATDAKGNPGSVLTPLYSAQGPLVIDTAGPAVTSAVYDQSARGFRVSFQDNLAGMNATGMFNRSHYILSASNGRTVAAQFVKAVPGDPNSVLVQFTTSRLIGRMTLMINSAGVNDRAGNPLAPGRFSSSITPPTPGTPWIAVFQTGSNSPAPARPYVSPSAQFQLSQQRRFLRGLRG